MRKHFLYVFYNIIYQLICFWVLLYANTYLNDGIVPKNLMWKDDKRRVDTNGLIGYATIKTLSLTGEAIILLLIIYVINQLILSDTEENIQRRIIANRTAKVEIIASLVFIAILIWGSFRH